MDKKEAFIRAIHEHQRLIFKVASIYTNRSEDRDDLMQEIVYQLWKSADTFLNESRLSTWMYRVAMNVAIHYLKQAKRNVVTIPLGDQFLNVRDIDPVGLDETWPILKQHIDQLNLLDKGIVLLYLENKSHDEIAQIIGLSTSNVGTRFSRIKEKLKQQILKQTP